MAQKQSPTVPSIVMNLSLVFICLTLVFLSTGFWGAGEANAPPQNLDPNWYQPVTARGMTLDVGYAEFQLPETDGDPDDVPLDGIAYRALAAAAASRA